jgi:hypothetical protein
MPSATFMDLLRWCYNHAAHAVSSSTALAFLTNVSDKTNLISLSAIKVKKLAKNNQY